MLIALLECSRDNLKQSVFRLSLFRICCCADVWYYEKLSNEIWAIIPLDQKGTMGEILSLYFLF